MYVIVIESDPYTLIYTSKKGFLVYFNNWQELQVSTSYGFSIWCYELPDGVNNLLNFHIIYHLSIFKSYNMTLLIFKTYFKHIH